MTAPATTAPAPAPAPAGTGLADTPVALLGRVPGRRLAAPALRAALAALATAPDRAAAEREVATAHGPAVRQERAALRSALLGDAFRPALAAGRPGDPVSRYLATGEQQPTAQEAAALEPAILEQLTRAMVRIGPPTAHTSVALGHWDEDGSSLDHPGLDPSRGRSVLSLDRPQLAMAVDSLSAGPDPAAAGPLPPLLRANWTLRLRGARAHFYRRDGEQLHLVATAVTGKVRALLGLVELGPLPAEVLLRELAAGLALTPEAAADLVAQAVRLQLLVGGSEFEGQDERPAAAAADFLTARHPAAAKLLTDVQARLDTAATSHGQQSADALAGLAEDQQALNSLLSHPIGLRVTEEYVLPPVRIAASPHRAALDDLALVLEFAALSDRVHDARALLVAAFTERFGSGARVRLADCAADLTAVVARRAQLLTPGSSTDFGPADGSLTELLRLRAAARALLDERITTGTGTATATAEVRLDPAELAALADGLPERFRRTHSSYGVLVRPLGDRLAVRGYHPGGGSSALRYTGTDRALGGEAHRRLAERLNRAADPAVLLEDRGLHGLDGNHRPPLLEDRIGPLGWLGLTLAHDAGTDTLELLDRDGAPVVVHSPALARPDRLAPSMRIALWLHGTGRLRIDPFGGVAADPHRTTGTLALPRLTAGQVVLQGRRWYPGEDLPTATGPGLLCELADWRAAHDVPEELLLVEPRPAGTDLDGLLGLLPSAPDRTRYVDLGSALLAETVRELPGGGYLEEVPVGVQDGAHALEWVLEYDRTPGGRFHGGARP
ncbi:MULTISPECIES: hypothetical protein [unclassified Kitasatospora]|uniref:hypothetical protein n=1 Tax=unclassified Kitasatospora TaxID=2633591 RepID=UPI00070AD9B8|nr:MULTISPECIES: hypothetical protein [unclassified Kitasatospora]KQV13252.1 hypothetical protein ASC99_08470 [Kitasatospora sp. Root107]KRB75300.1 hypothetical protein ASE03_14935 [Kitasatospora sp. Root187]